MASTDARPVPQKNVAYRVTFPILDADGDLVTGATGLDSEVSKDAGTFADCTNEATEIATSSGMYYLDLTSTEMNADCVAIIVKTSSSGAKTTPIILYPEEAGDIRVNVTQFGGSNGTFASGRPEVNTTHLAGTSQTARDIGASVLLSSGTGTGQVTLTSGRVNADLTHIATAAVSTSTAQLGVNVVNFGGSAGTFASGRPEVNASHIGGSAISQTSGVANVNVAQISGDSTAADNAESFFDGTGYAGTNNVIPTVTTVNGLAANTVNASALASDAVTEIQSGLATASALSTAQTDITTIKGYTDDIGTAGAGLTAIPWNASWDAEVQSEVQDAIEANNLDHLVKSAVDTDWATTVHLNSVIGHIADNGTTATFDRTTDSLEALQAEHDVTQGKVDAVDDYVDTEVAAIKTVVDAIKLSTDNLPSDPADASVIAGLISGLDAKLDTIDNFVDTEVAAIKTVTDKVDTALVLDGAVYQFTANALELAPTGGSAPTAADIADAVWDEVLSGHLTGGSTGNALNAAGSAGDPWATSLPGAYGSGTAGKIIGDNINATISSRASQTSLDTLDDYVDTEVAAIKAKTDNLPASPANEATLTTIAGYIDTEVAAIKAKTDNLPASPAATSDCITAAGVRSAVGLASANLDTQLTAIDDYIDTEVSAIKAKTDNLPASPANEATLTTIAGYIDTEVAAIKAKTDQLTFTTSNRVDSTAITVSDKTGYSLSSAGIQAIWDALTSALTTVGSVGKWIVDKLDVVVSTRASQTSLDTLDDYVDTEVAAIKAKTDNLPASPANESTLTTIAGYIDTEVAAIKAKTDNLPTDPADASDIAASFSTVNSTLATIAGYIDTEVAAIKAKTDNLPSDPADASDIASAFSTVNTKLDTIDDFLDTEVAAIKAKTDSLTFTVAGQVDANVNYVNETAVGGSGTSGDPWGPE